MNVTLNAIEARVIGCLMEKSMITPEQYPLSLNALLNACNQKSSREPVMNLSESEVADALVALQRRYLVREKSGFGGRVPKYHYRLYNDEIGDFRFSPAERAVICLLLLRGPQTPGELRSRAGRMHDFDGVDAVERTLEDLARYEQGPFVTRLAREPGRREFRFAECFTAGSEAAAGSGAAAGSEAAAVAGASGGAAPERGAQDVSAATGGAVTAGAAASTDPDLTARITRLEQRVAALEAALTAITAGRNGDA